MIPLDQNTRTALVQRARAAIARAIGVRPDAVTPVPARIPDPQVSGRERSRFGAFVTIRINGQLRGCIGVPEADLPLVDAVERCAVSAALSDPRFPPLSEAEWKDIDLELSLLGPIELVGDLRDIVVGRDGLIVESGRSRGLLLPQVAVEWQWDAAEFAAQACIKAGLPRDAVMTGAKLFKFEAEVFGDSEAY